MRRNFYDYILSALIATILFSGNNSAQIYNYNLNRFGDEAVEMFKQPANWNTKDWLILTGIAGGTFALMHVDEDPRTITKSDRSFDNFLPIVIGDKYGEGWGALLLGASFLTAGILQNNTTNERFGFEVLQSFIYAETITGILKFGFGRARPFMNEGALSYRPFQISTTDYFSLPSGHTTCAFSLSTVLAAQSENLLIKIASFTPAIFTAIARIYYDEHWASDVFLGAAIGYFVGKYVTELHKQNSQDQLNLSNTNSISLIIPF